MTDPLPTFPMSRRTALDPPSAYSTTEPIRRVRLYDNRSAWLVTGYDEVRQVLGSDKVSADRRHAEFPFSSPSREALERADPTFVTFDDPDHARIRRVFTGYFTVRKIAQQRSVVSELVHDLIDELALQPQTANFVSAFASEVPARTICHFLGLPLSERGFFQQIDNQRNTLSTDPANVRAATAALLDFADRMIAEKRANPDDALISKLVHSDSVSVLSAQELLYAVRLLITAGHETTSNMIGLGVASLLTYRDQWQALCDDPSLIPGAVEELLRYVSIFHISPTRIAIEPFELAGQHIQPGDGIFPVTAAANRDAEVFDRPDTLDIRRPAQHHVAFGYGIHQCLGQPLARLELSVVLEALTSRVPSLRFARPEQELELEDYAFLRLRSLALAWGSIADRVALDEESTE